MPTEEDLKSIIVHKKYTSSRKSSKGRKRKRSTTSEESNASESGEERREKDVGFVPSRFLKGSSGRKARSSRTRHDRREGEEDSEYRKRREERAREERPREERPREERARDSRDDRVREERPRDERSRDDRDRSRDDRDKSRDERPREERSREERPREERSRDDRARDERVRDDRAKSRDDRVKEEESRYRKEGYRREAERSPRRRDNEEARDKSPRGGPDRRRSAKNDPRRPQRKGDWREDDEDYDPISDEELAMLEEDAGVLEIYKEIEREMRSKRYSASVDHIDFSVLKILTPTRELDRDPLTVFEKCGYSATYGGKALTERIKAMATSAGKDFSTQGAYSLEKKSITDICKETLSPHVALSSYTDNLLRQRLASRDKHVSAVVVDDRREPGSNTLLSEAVKLFNQRAGTALEIK